MQNSSAAADQRRHKLKSQRPLVSRNNAGRALVGLASLGCLLVLLIQILHATGAIHAGFADWRPILYAYLLWGVALGWALGGTEAFGAAGVLPVFAAG